jgi:hypothetical protein
MASGTFSPIGDVGDELVQVLNVECFRDTPHSNHIVNMIPVRLTDALNDYKSMPRVRR